jgi:F0F1-type ATP synthase assembly protein I
MLHCYSFLMADQPPGKNPNVWRQIGKYSHLGFVLPAAVLVGLLIGSALDRHFHTKWITVVGLLVGSVAGFIELMRGVMGASKES